eukprot:154076-Pyramimonas_sp.AAC.1
MVPETWLMVPRNNMFSKRNVAVALLAFAYLIFNPYFKPVAVEVEETPLEAHDRTQLPDQVQAGATDDAMVAQVASSFNEFGLELFNTLAGVEDGN